MKIDLEIGQKPPFISINLQLFLNTYVKVTTHLNVLSSLEIILRS